mmetsp:Transcript_18230/g.27088  ORF Transcript_18230/g.27088 Transcript_18230/m.27088 type:complete len:440 (+) Transcript_18230:118-1437(+)|eukprot:scaffold1681_cov113-Skeletonema_dohrnii-CCMP3373.AAC.6
MTADEKKDSTTVPPKEEDSTEREEPAAAEGGSPAPGAGTSTQGEGPIAGFGPMPGMAGANPMMMGQFNNPMMGGQFASNMMGGFPAGDSNAQLAAQAMMRKRQLEMAGDDFAPTVGAKRAKAEVESAALKQAVADASASPSNLPQQAPIPPSKEGIKFYSRNDVLCGRGGGTNVHPGNRRFRDLINANRRAYLKARKNDKPAISRSIVRTIREMNGRFLKKDEKQGLWFEIGDDGAREKTSQALRQRAPEMRKILFEDEQRQQQAQQEAIMQRQFMMHQGQMPGMMGQGMQMGMNGMQMQGRMGMQGMHPGMMGGMNPMSGMGGMGGAPSMGMGMAGMNAENFAAMPSQMTGSMTGSMPSSSGMGGTSATGGGNGGAGEDPQAMMAKYNMLHQKNLLAQEKAMLMQRLAGISNQQNSIETMTTNTLLSQGQKPPTPRGA